MLRMIGPLYFDKERIEHTNKKTGEKITALNNIKGIRTQRFQERWNMLNQAKIFILAYENPQISKHGRWTAGQRAYEILHQLTFLILQDVEDLGLNKKDKIPGAAAALTGT